jgi:mannose-6-phosphate isomerase-like protein (cupin superfamily)
MGGFTIKNLMEIEDTAGPDYPGVEARFARKHIDSDHLGLTYLRYAPGVRSSPGHRHREQEEVYVVIGGSGRIRLDDEVRELQLWDVVRISPSTVRGVEGGPDGIELIAVGSDRPEGGDGVRADTPWPDETQ